jgi:hypothetical protein
MLQFKRGVIQSEVSSQVWFAIGVTYEIYQHHTQACTVTSLRDGKHSAASLHYGGHAVDLRTRDLTAELLNSIYSEIRARLFPLGFDVIKETDHIHCEYDPKPGREWSVEVE